MPRKTKAQHVTSPVVIVGNGLAGQVMALSLARRDIACTLIGPARDTQPNDQRTTAIMDDGIACLASLNLWAADQLQAVPLQTMRLLSGDAQIDFHATDIGLAQFGFNIANMQLHTLLADQIAASSLITIVAAAVTKIDVNTDNLQATVTCDNDQQIITSLVIGADGKNSVVRQAAGIAVTHTSLDQHALVCVVHSDEPHEFTSTEWYHRGGPFTVVPMADTLDGEHRMAVVYCDTKAQINDLVQMSIDELGTYFTDFSNALFGTLRVVNTPQIWPVEPQRSTALIASCIALIGEAAHVLPPLAAQGFNISLRDIQALSNVIANALQVGIVPGQLAVLRRYADARSLDMRVRGHGVNMLNRLIRQDDHIGRKLHAFGFNALNRLPAVKTLVMRQALAPHRTGFAA